MPSSAALLRDPTPPNDLCAHGAVKWVQVEEERSRVNHRWMVLFLPFPFTSLKIGANARMVVGYHRILQIGHCLLQSVGDT